MRTTGSHEPCVYVARRQDGLLTVGTVNEDSLGARLDWLAERAGQRVSIVMVVWPQESVEHALQCAFAWDIVDVDGPDAHWGRPSRALRDAMCPPDPEPTVPARAAFAAHTTSDFRRAG